MSLALEWIKQCVEDHPRCSREPHPLLPYRVLDVADGKDPQLRVNSRQDRGNYVALSHCWGTKESLKTVTSTLGEHLNGISFAKFPKTFQDVIVVCWRLGIPYLWIDSLCIIQDSKDDWATQSAQMSDIYSNAIVTISADAAPDSHCGFLKCEQRMIPVKRFEVPGSGSERTEICIRKKGAGDRDSFNHHFWRGPARSPLSRRGWILQESVLSPRILHFTAEELTWECATLSRCECQYGPHIFPSSKPLKLRIDDLLFHRRWGTLVDNFTDRHLSYWADRLPAISGIAQKMQASTKAKYCAGLWSDAFPQCLLWRVLDRHEDMPFRACISTRIEPYHAPTWSWASVTGRVIIPSGDNNTAEPSDIEVICKPATPNPYGSLLSAELRINCFLIPIEIFEGPSPEHPGAKIHCFSEKISEGAKLCAELIPDVQGSGYETRFQDPHWALMVGGCFNDGLIGLRAAVSRPDSYERIGLLVTNDSFQKWLGIAIKQEVVIV